MCVISSRAPSVKGIWVLSFTLMHAVGGGGSRLIDLVDLAERV